MSSGEYKNSVLQKYSEKVHSKNYKELNKWISILHIYQQIQYCQGVSSCQLDLQIQCNSNQNPSILFYGYRWTDPKFSMERKIPRIANTILKKNKVGEWHFLTPRLTIKLCNQDRAVWHWWRRDKKDQWEKTERPEASHMDYSQQSFDKVKAKQNRVLTMEKIQSFQKMMQKNYSRQRPYTLHKNYLKIDYRPKCKM